MTDLEECAKAISDTAKLGITVVEATEKIGGFLSHILNEPFTEAVGIFGDKLKFMRWKRKLRIVDEVNRILDEKGVKDIRPIPPKLAIPMLEQASWEEEDELQDIWCNLIANSLNPVFDVEIRYAYIDILKNLTSLDAKILKYIYDTIEDKSRLDEITNLNNHPISIDQIKENTTLASDSEIKLSLYNLKRVQCVWDYKSNSIVAGNIALRGRNDNYYILTPLGSTLIEACMK